MKVEYLCMFVHSCVWGFVYVCMCLHVCVFVCMCDCMYVYIHVHVCVLVYKRSPHQLSTHQLVPVVPQQHCHGLHIWSEPEL